MDIEKCSNQECGKLFQLSEMKMAMPGTKEKEDISCPYCGHTITRMSNGVFRTHELSEEQVRKLEECK
jgi:DNA-directed RNA polymerase subunit RPC12/RpoP